MIFGRFSRSKRPWLTMDPDEQPDPKNVPLLADVKGLQEALATIHDRLDRVLVFIRHDSDPEAIMEAERARWVIRACGIKPKKHAMIGSDEVEIYRENERIERL